MATMTDTHQALAPADGAPTASDRPATVLPTLVRPTVGPPGAGTAPDADDPVHVVVVGGSRFQLPAALDQVARLHVHTIGDGWCELSELAPVHPLPAGEVAVGGRRRFRLPDAAAYRRRWACRNGEPVLVLARFDARTGAHQVLLLAMRRLLAELDTLRPPRLYPGERPLGPAAVPASPAAGAADENR